MHIRVGDVLTNVECAVRSALLGDGKNPSCAAPPPHGLSAEGVRAEWLQALLVCGVWLLMFQLLVPVSVKQSLHTWCSKKFQVHRLGGLAFLFQYGWAWQCFILDYDGSFRSMGFPALGVALTGLFQAVSATLTFTFLPNSKDPGYFSDRSIMSRLFVKENLFYQLMNVWGCVYYSDAGYNFMRYGATQGPCLRDAATQVCAAGWAPPAPGVKLACNVLEVAFVFFPYAWLRPCFPTTHFSTALGNVETKATQANQWFYFVGTWAIKIFYVWAKHFMGFHINYMRFLGLFSEADMQWVRGLWLLNAGTVSIAVFLHTMRFKKLLPPRTTFSCYLVMAYASFSGLRVLLPGFAQHPKLVAATALGMGLNFWRGKQWVLKAFWACAAVAFSLARLAPDFASNQGWSGALQAAAAANGGEAVAGLNASGLGGTWVEAVVTGPWPASLATALSLTSADA